MNDPSPGWLKAPRDLAQALLNSLIMQIALQNQLQQQESEPLPTHQGLRRILVVDDDVDTAQAIKFLVERHGNAVCELACDPYEALVALADHDFDLIFMDQKLPGLKGAQVLSKMDEFVDQDPLIVESGRYAQSLPTVIMSGTDVLLGDHYKLKHFDLLKVINKKNLVNFLSLNFSEPTQTIFT